MNNMSKKPDRTDNIQLKMDNGNYCVAEIAVTFDGLKAYMPGDEEVYNWERIQSEFDFIGWDYLNPEVVVEWVENEMGLKAKIGPILFTIVSVNDTEYSWNIYGFGCLLARDQSDSLDAAQAAAMTWSNDNLATVPRGRMK